MWSHISKFRYIAQLSQQPKLHNQRLFAIKIKMFDCAQEQEKEVKQEERQRHSEKGGESETSESTAVRKMRVMVCVRAKSVIKDWQQKRQKHIAGAGAQVCKNYSGWCEFLRYV